MDTIEGLETKSLEKCRALGVNDSMVHVDFMIGTEDLNIDAITRDGRSRSSGSEIGRSKYEIRNKKISYKEMLALFPLLLI